MISIVPSTSAEIRARVHPGAGPGVLSIDRQHAAVGHGAVSPLPTEIMHRILNFLDDRTATVRMRATCRANNDMVVGHSNFYASHLMDAFLAGNDQLEASLKHHISRTTKLKISDTYLSSRVGSEYHYANTQASRLQQDSRIAVALLKHAVNLRYLLIAHSGMLFCPSSGERLFLPTLPRLKNVEMEPRYYALSPLRGVLNNGGPAGTWPSSFNHKLITMAEPLNLAQRPWQSSRVGRPGTLAIHSTSEEMAPLAPTQSAPPWQSSAFAMLRAVKIGSDSDVPFITPESFVCLCRFLPITVRSFCAQSLDESCAEKHFSELMRLQCTQLEELHLDRHCTL